MVDEEKLTPEDYIIDLFDKLRADAMKGRYDTDLWDEFRREMLSYRLIVKTLASLLFESR